MSRFEAADAENLPFEHETFDLVTCRIAPHHFPDCALFVTECARVLKKDGLLLIQDHVLPDTRKSSSSMSIHLKNSATLVTTALLQSMNGLECLKMLDLIN